MVVIRMRGIVRVAATVALAQGMPGCTRENPLFGRTEGGEALTDSGGTSTDGGPATAGESDPSITTGPGPSSSGAHDSDTGTTTSLDETDSDSTDLCDVSDLTLLSPGVFRSGVPDTPVCDGMGQAGYFSAYQGEVISSEGSRVTLSECSECSCMTDLEVEIEFGTSVSFGERECVEIDMFSAAATEGGCAYLGFIIRDAGVPQFVGYDGIPPLSFWEDLVVSFEHDRDCDDAIDCPNDPIRAGLYALRFGNTVVRVGEEDAQVDIGGSTYRVHVRKASANRGSNCGLFISWTAERL
jgi:hypothetical protein